MTHFTLIQFSCTYNLKKEFKNLFKMSVHSGIKT